jgi:hypothetical protein
MRKLLLLTLCLSVIPAIADDVYTFNLLPPDGNVAGAAGSTLGWGYSIQNKSTTDWLVTTDLTAGSFQNATPDLIFDFPDVAPGATATVAFDAAIPAGLYELTWNTSAPPEFTNAGAFVLSAEWWNGDPLNGGTFVSNALNSSRAYAATATPEPETFGLSGLALLFISVVLRRRMSRL